MEQLDHDLAMRICWALLQQLKAEGFTISLTYSNAVKEWYATVSRSRGGVRGDGRADYYYGALVRAINDYDQQVLP